MDKLFYILSFTSLLLCFSTGVFAQEICDNGIDDDGDGLIDCCDPDVSGSVCCAEYILDPSSCTNLPNDTTFQVDIEWESDYYVPNAVNSMLVGDIDGDDSTEIIIMNYVGGTNNVLGWQGTDSILIVRGSDGTVKYSYPLPGNVPLYFKSWGALGDVDCDTRGDLFYYTQDSVYRYEFDPNADGGNGGLSLEATAYVPLPSLYQNDYMNLTLGDVNADGNPELVIGNIIFDAQTLNYIVDGGATNHFGVNQMFPNDFRSGTALMDVLPFDAATCAFCDGLELIAGGQVYGIDIAGAQMQVVRDFTTVVPGIGDGVTSVADIDDNGKYDAVVIHQPSASSGLYRVYAYEIESLTALSANPLGYETYTAGNSSGPGRANLGNFDTDSLLEISFVANDVLFVLENDLTLKWQLASVDISGATGAVVFDFLGDGIQEIVYRDETALYIYDASQATPSLLYAAPCFSTTAQEYPIIADVDDDGQTEITCTCIDEAFLNFSIHSVGPGLLRTFKNNSGAPWMATRSVWNQHGYNITNVTDNLLIPAVPMDNLSIVDPNGYKPLNSFMNQVTSLSPDFLPFIKVADATAIIGEVICDPDSIHVSFTICNVGDNILPDDMSATFYSDDPTVVSPIILDSLILGVNLEVDSCQTFTQTLVKDFSYNYFIVVNDDRSTTPIYDLITDFPVSAIAECDFINNLIPIELPGPTMSPDLGVDQLLCNGGTVTLNVSPGFISYEWFNGSTGNSALVSSTGDYWLDGMDICGNVVRDSVYIQIDSIISSMAVSSDYNGQDITCFGANDGEATASPGGSTAPYSYLWSNGQSTQIATGLLANTMYTVTITDANSCTITDDITLGTPIVLGSSIPTPGPVCLGFSTGVIDLTVSGGTAPFTYNWDNAPNVEDPSSLPGGTYNVTVTDANGCSLTDMVTIQELTSLQTTFVATNPLCFGSSDGAIDLSPNGGLPPYTYSWDNMMASEDISSLTAGTYNVTVVDANGCSGTNSVVLTEPALLQASYTSMPTSCFGGSDGTATPTVSGGTPPYTYTWDNAETTEIATALNAGNHNMTVTDANACSFVGFVIVTEPALLQSQNISETGVSCFAESDGTTTATGIGGTPPYTFNWSNAQATATATGLAAGFYSVTITDANSCTTSDNITVSTPAVLATSAPTPQPVCNGNMNGMIDLTVTGGTIPYTYDWDNAPDVQDPNGLAWGDYTVTVTDANGCSTTEFVQISELSSLAIVDVVTDILCFGGNNGGIDLSVSGGLPPYTYVWSNAATSEDLVGLIAGQYGITVTDANLCVSSMLIMVSEPADLLATYAVSDASCNGANDASATANVSGGTPPYTYTWDSGEVSQTALALTFGSHTMTVTDANSCLYIGSFSIQEPAPLLPLTINPVPVTCLGGNDGSATVVATGGSIPYTYTWSNMQTGTTATGLSAGLYDLVITDANNCYAPSISIEIQEPATAVSLDISSEPASCFGENDGIASVLATGGNPSYTYLWSSGSIAYNAIGLTAGTYTVTVLDQNGCSSVETVSVDEPDKVLADFTKEDVVCYEDNNGQITIDSAYGGIGPYVYSLDGETYQTGDVFGGLFSGNYDLYVQDENGCEYIINSIVIDEQPELVLSIAEVETLSLGDSVELRPSLSLISDVTYSWDPPAGLSCIDCENPIARPIETTTYTLTVTDTLHDCTVSEQVIVPINKVRNIFVPTGFSPNEDGVNDLFLVYGGIGVEEVLDFKVFDRWGELVFEAQNILPNDTGNAWNGTFRGKKLTPGVFVYYADIRFYDGKTIQYKGDVTLVR